MENPKTPVDVIETVLLHDSTQLVRAAAQKALAGFATSDVSPTGAV